jgi:hypothetical protein
MGLLDDAIREHLDLKRRRGGDPTEIERAERDALGPVRRGPEVAQEQEEAFEESSAYDHEPVADDHGELGTSGAYDHEQEHDGLESGHIAESEWGLELSPPPAAADRPAASESSLPEPAPGDHEEPASARPAARDHEPPPRPGSDPHGGQETVEYDVEGELQHEPGDDDVLEETPEFLQDTPDHDRLWFEQKPPRDFDFNG